MQHVTIALTAVLVVSATVSIHALGTYSLTRHLSRFFTDAKGHFTRSKALLAMIGSATTLLLLHVIEIHLWALTYLFIEPFPELMTFESASYFSFVTFTTLGYGDITLAQHDWRILTGVEALNGILLAGWSTAFLFAVVQRTWNHIGHDHSDA